MRRWHGRGGREYGVPAPGVLEDILCSEKHNGPLKAETSKGPPNAPLRRAAPPPMGKPPLAGTALPPPSSQGEPNSAREASPPPGWMSSPKGLLSLPLNLARGTGQIKALALSPPLPARLPTAARRKASPSGRSSWITGSLPSSTPPAALRRATSSWPCPAPAPMRRSRPASGPLPCLAGEHWPVRQKDGSSFLTPRQGREYPCANSASFRAQSTDSPPEQPGEGVRTPGDPP